jgi:beta-galactosidase
MKKSQKTDSFLCVPEGGPKPRLRSRVGLCGGVPTLYVNGTPFPAAAYMTYLAAYNDYAGFAAAGYRLFSVPVLFAGRWINAQVDGVPFHKGIFDEKGKPDFSALDAAVRCVLAACPEAFVFPRLNCAMPLWWIAEHPERTDGTGKRELLFTGAYREAAAGMLRAVIRHIEESDYAARIVGYQLAGGNTEEWFHFDLGGGCCPNAEGPFHEYLQKTGAGDISGLPDLSGLQGAGPCHGDERLRKYLEFSNTEVARTVETLCAVAKEETGGTLAVGTFYGYSLEVSSPLWGTHALSLLLRSPHVDFICSPNSYIGLRDPAADWTEMYPADSVRLHGKLCMQECDIRTHLTRFLWQTAPEFDPQKRYTAPVWQGPTSAEESLNALRKTFCRQLVKGNGFWWFDMWGGWYNDPEILSLMSNMRNVYSESLSKQVRSSTAETAVFVDESAFKYMTACPLRNTAFNQRNALGLMGAPYDIYDVSDFEQVYAKYKAIIFLSDLKTDNMSRALEICRESGVKYISASNLKKEFSAPQLRAFCSAQGVHIYCGSDDIIYANGNYIALCSIDGGAKEITLGGNFAYRELLAENGIEGRGNTIKVQMNAHETRLFELTSD